MIPDHTLSLDELPVGCVKSHFLDSGAYSMMAKAEKHAETTGESKWEFYKTDEFFQYMDRYAAFVKKYHYAIDLYANVDAIKNPKISWRNQRYLEDVHGLKPVPVVHSGHAGKNLQWLKFYVDKGYPIIGLGGLVGRTSKTALRRWIDRAFELVCGSDGLPTVKLHGFGITVYSLLIKYPWWSVDSTSWTKIAAYGGVFFPHLRQGEWDFSDNPYVMKVSLDSPQRKVRNQHLMNLGPTEQKILQKWLSDIEVPLGENDKYGEPIKWGVINQHTYRKAANLLFFERLRSWLPDYPWAFRSRRQKGFIH